MLAKIRTLYLGYVVVFEKLAERSLNLMGWEIDNHCPLELDQYVMIAAPHTSNWDALYARLGLKALGVNVCLTIKDSYMKLPFGPFVRAMGGIGIDRRPKAPGEARPSMVQLMTDLFKTHPKLVMLVTPEATRARQEQWKTGFYHVAVNAGVPIALAYMDYAKKKTGIGKIIFPTGDYEKDMAEIMAFYAQIEAKFPENFSVDTRYYSE
ncbi:1-acyl-sn-glycerol-3-phosphate acyltransferase [Acinetobacter towneri]|uniref:1-acyl-sn-glycerol-3-phosphate acyltransferase n=1 Tax=Acinetobacter towneri TaxID=202956 RepID=UPI000375DBAC